MERKEVLRVERTNLSGRLIALDKTGVEFIEGCSRDILAISQDDICTTRGTLRGLSSPDNRSTKPEPDQGWINLFCTNDSIKLLIKPYSVRAFANPGFGSNKMSKSLSILGSKPF